MSDFETRLTEGLSGVAERSPHPGDLGAAARGRLRRRRRTTTATVAAALAVVAIPVGLTVVGTGDERGPDRRETTVTEPVPDDWRAETWGDLTLRVPPEWGWGSGTDWCTTEESAATATPVVSRPGQVARAIGCVPTYGYGVHFFAPSGGELPPGTEGAVQQYRGRRYPYGAWIGYASTGQAAVWVVTDSRTLTRQVLDSTEAVGEVDPNGCATQVPPVARRSEPRVSVCRYDSGSLEQSELLSAADSRAVVEAVRSASSAEALRPACAPYSLEQPVITLQSTDVDARLLPSKRCNIATVFLDRVREKLLTEDVLYWALSPGWSGWVPRGVPMPDELRRE